MTGITTYSTPRRLALIARGLPRGDRGGQRGTEGAADLGAAAGAGRLPAQDRADAGPARGPRRHLVRDDRQAGPGDQRSAGRSGRGRSSATFPGPSRCAGARHRSRPSSLRWVRPLHSIVALLGEEIVPVAIDGVECGATTRRPSLPPSRADHHRRGARLCREAARLPCDRRPGGARGDHPRRRGRGGRRRPASRWSRTRGWWSRMPA